MIIILFIKNEPQFSVFKLRSKKKNQIFQLIIVIMALLVVRVLKRDYRGPTTDAKAGSEIDYYDTIKSDIH
jgi:hypothetical protein